MNVTRQIHRNPCIQQVKLHAIAQATVRERRAYFYVHHYKGCSPKKEVGGRLKQDSDKDLQLHKILILLY